MERWIGRSIPRPSSLRTVIRTWSIRYCREIPSYFPRYRTSCTPDSSKPSSLLFLLFLFLVLFLSLFAYRTDQNRPEQTRNSVAVVSKRCQCHDHDRSDEKKKPHHSTTHMIHITPYLERTPHTIHDIEYNRPH